LCVSQCLRNLNAQALLTKGTGISRLDTLLTLGPTQSQ